MNRWRLRPYALGFAVLALSSSSPSAWSKPIYDKVSDPTGLAEYVSTYELEPEQVLVLGGLNPSARGKLASIRFDTGGESSNLLQTFYGKEPRSTDAQTHSRGLQALIPEYFHRRYFEQHKAVEQLIKVKQAELRGVQGRIDAFRRHWLEEGRDPALALDAPGVQELLKQRTKTGLELSQQKVKLSRIGRETNGEGNLNERIAHSTRLFSELLGLTIAVCPNASASKMRELDQCKGEAAEKVTAKLEEVRAYDRSLTGTLDSPLSVEGLFGESTLDSAGHGYLFGNYLLNLYGIKSLGCFADNDTAKPICQVVKLNTRTEPLEALAATERKHAAELLAARQTESDSHDSKGMKEALRGARETDAAAQREIDSSLTPLH